MLEVQINLVPGGHESRRKTIQTIAIWNTSDLADISNYDYAVSYSIPMGMPDEAYSALECARNPGICEFRGSIFSWPRSQEAFLLVKKILDEIAEKKNGNTD